MCEDKTLMEWWRGVGGWVCKYFMKDFQLMKIALRKCKYVLFFCWGGGGVLGCWGGGGGVLGCIGGRERVEE